MACKIDETVKLIDELIESGKEYFSNYPSDIAKLNKAKDKLNAFKSLKMKSQSITPGSESEAQETNNDITFKKHDDTYYTKNSVIYRKYRIPKPSDKESVVLRNITESMIKALRSDLNFGNGVKDMEDTFGKYTNIYTKEIKDLSILLRDHQINLSNPHTIDEWKSIYKQDVEINKKVDDTINDLVENLGLDKVIKTDAIDGYEFAFGSRLVIDKSEVQAYKQFSKDDIEAAKDIMSKNKKECE